MFVHPVFQHGEDWANLVMLRADYPAASYAGHYCRGSRQLIGHENEYDEILRMLLMDNMSVTAELNCGAGYTTELYFARLTGKDVIAEG
jgi:hypothetical protein